MKNRTPTKDLKEQVGGEVTVAGFVDVRRDHGKLIFIDLRDESGKVQIIALPGRKEAHELAGAIRPEWVISVTGKVNKRPEKLINKNEPNGEVELEALSIAVINKAETPPIEVRGDGHDIGEESRLKYRYLDLRRPRMQQNLRLRHKIIKFIRDYLDREGFIEIETPELTKSTPEGARDFIVPSRREQGLFYALPQSPQQYKQLLMVAGFEKYFQIARCFRDEDTRGDRQPEFTQLDLEMAYVEREDVMDLNEKLLIELVQEIAPHKKIQELPFPRISYKEAMSTYKTDRPDLRTDKNDPNLLAFCWVIDFPFFEKADDGSWTFTHNPFSSPKPEHKEWLLKGERIPEILTTQYDVALNGSEIGGGSIRGSNPETIEAVFKVMGYPMEDIKKNFGHMLEAYRYGAPEHGGIAWGLDRFVTILANESSIREVIAFAKTGEGRDLMMNAPAEVKPTQLKELGIRLNQK
ncbi:MAG: hypothetical protein A2W52_03890 [Candidatus Taylorbacteria bacterium RIFCSPHIGHO2_02_49_25]|uniref:Aspartate--tRNA(Asp/Asn) ligase n=1 Tax=Candidatus Taylorbacteria bacterium RIFCSPHIGHO2_02_49_25 TaxID=1802305 RepID=A0A1G2MI04_9BACT|nr:MAG: Aspartyl-tRNA synthetase [Parcubacteria group bacterium GW2011_GWF2_50_9]OHA20212.1 MAG: hypothetical protein A2759_01595 [Candidatus Taylorbacteria bacterium RIFCSPHIGHO2_01_FULL_49_60]OHA23526.1 MAG: hypothetical protein A2W52_03890 [Candidatus Taylorbacteria bacterium RIFCSPHIGHO2_02_49_25]OHA35764.1 MAG: hypothetical protein A3B27_02350 [Candidatus Taylorbacteria bacterium RIFCSPLOWO2_01_FULL_50_130]OHA36939.1 MAG: hypothetical protein A2W65_03890 [Candidatus Taylorbacteria bacteriu